MALWQNLPSFCILLSLFSAAVTSVLPARAARSVATCAVGAVLAMSAVVLANVTALGESYVYMMGHFPAPWGNEIRAGTLEAVTALIFSAILLLSLVAGYRRLDEHIERGKQNLYFVMVELLQAALMAEIYTNDLFTAYVFVEIMTIAACSLITARSKGQTLVAATRYMIMNLLGSGLFLLGITLLYDLTGHLLMSNIKEEVARLAATGLYGQPLTVVVILLTVGLCIKSALFPFHTWLPDAYSNATPTSSAILSSLVSKAYIFLLIKIIYRVIGFEVFAAERINDVLFVFSIAAILIGSLLAIREKDIRRMIAYSSVAQIGYVFLGIGIGTQDAMVAALFHIFAHAAAKSMLFLAASGLYEASGESKRFRDLRGSGYRNPLAGVAFTVGALSIVGIPLLGGFISKLWFMRASVLAGGIRMPVVLAALVISTLLNTIYFMKTVLTLYRPALPDALPGKRVKPALSYAVAVGAMILLNFALGIGARPLLQAIVSGLGMFA